MLETWQIPVWPAIALLVLSYVLSHVVAWYLQVRREQRIQQKTEKLATKSHSSDLDDAATSLPSVPVTILTGYLGAGKTTLLNRILLAPSLPYKVMVLENEIGAISIDHSLLESGMASLGDDGIYVLANGCMCCTASSTGSKGSNELERILDYLLRISAEQGFDYLVIETTGLADPGPIIETFLRLRASRFRLDGIVTMVDANAAQRFWEEDIQEYAFPIELQRQLLYADTIALNKVDMVGNDTLKLRLESAITEMNEEATLERCQHANLELSTILGMNTFDEVRFRGTNSVVDVDTTTGMHAGDIGTHHFEVHQSVDLLRLGKWLSDVVDEYAKAHVFRVKGVVAVEGEHRRCVVQCVLDTYTIAPSSPWKQDEERVSKLVVIGKQLNRAALEEGFYSCLVESDGPETKEGKEGKKDM